MIDFQELQILVDTFGTVEAGLVFTVFLGFVIGIVSALFGIGGGFVITPYFDTVVGLGGVSAVATSTTQMPLMALSAVLTYVRKQLVQYRAAFYLMATSIPVAQGVAWLLSRMGRRPSAGGPAGYTTADWIILVVYVLMIGYLGLYNLRRANSFDQQPVQDHPAPEPVAFLHTAGLGIVIGAASATLGIGGGFLAFPYFVYRCGFTPAQAVATSMFAIVVTSALTAARYIAQGDAMILLALCVASGSVVGAQIGARMAINMAPGRLIRFLGWAQLLVTAAYVLRKAVFPLL